jgi:hypothetical protein
MANRREFMVAGALAAGAAPIAHAEGVAAAIPERNADLYTVVYDERFPDSVAFARRARVQGLRVSAIQGDITRLWYDDLYHRWKMGPAAIAGLTAADAFFCLEMFGADAGLRRVLKVEHRAGAGGVEHRMEGPAPLLREASLADCGPAWPARMAQLAARCPASRARRIETVAATAGETLQGDYPALVSWVLAPVKRAPLRVV